MENNKDYIGDIKAKMFDDLLLIAAEDKAEDWTDEAIGKDIANALYYYGRAIKLIEE